MTDQSDDQASGPAAPRRSRARWVLIGSLCLNLLLLGGMGGAVLRHGGDHPPPPAGLDPVSLMRAMHSLPDDRRDEARAILRDHRPKFEAQRPARHAARKAIAERLAAEPFDGAALATALDAARVADAAGRAVIDDAFVEFAAQLSPESRQKLATEILERRSRRGRGKREHRGD
jgi:uncharacterized membrane protein